MEKEYAGVTGQKCVLACVTVQRGCARLIRRGGELARSVGMPLYVLHVCTDNAALGGEDASAALNDLFRLSHETDAQMSILYEADAPKAIIAFARGHHAEYIVLGAGALDGESDVIKEIREGLPGTNLEICGG